MNPPPIGEALSVGWAKFKDNMVPVLIGILCAALLGLIPVVGQFLAMPGMFLVALKALRGQAPEPSDGFVGMQAAVDNIVMGLLQILGLIACCVGQIVTQAIFFQGTFLIVDKGMTWSDAKDKCMDEIKPNWLNWTVFVFVMSLVAASGMIACIVGVFFTAPIALIAYAYAYEQTLGAKKA